MSTGYEEKRDGERLRLQARRLLDYLRGTADRWQTVEEICAALSQQYPGEKFPAASISAQLRNLRKVSLGSHDVRGEYQPHPIYKYRLFAPANMPAKQEKLFDLRQQDYRESVQ